MIGSTPLRLVLLGMFLVSIGFSAFSGFDNLNLTMNALCAQARSLLGVAMMTMIILAGVVYAMGQLLGAETRARATVWATAMLTGALIAAIIFIIAPAILTSLLGGESGIALSCGTPS
ncbi:hypothetical protein HY990_02030 [Candidatus Micrarchaeota archaeon]|nr:hypothetical protein [Candidatus Micrarchaeota archaeon]